VRKTAADVNREFLAWIPREGTPFFAFLNYFDAHEPYETHPPFDRLFSDHSPRFWLMGGWQRSGSPVALQELVDAYDSGIAYLDYQVGTLLRELEARGILQNTIVVLTSDHGEHFGDHGGITSHANSLYLPLLHVPLVISYPPTVPGGLRVADPVGLASIGATIRELVGDEGSGRLAGTSLVEHWEEDPDSARTASAPAQALLSLLTPNTFAHPRDPVSKGPMQSLILGSLHYIRNGDGKEELYDLSSDPLELENLSESPDHASAINRFRDLLRDTLENAPAPRS